MFHILNSVLKNYTIAGTLSCYKSVWRIKCYKMPWCYHFTLKTFQDSNNKKKASANKQLCLSQCTIPLCVGFVLSFVLHMFEPFFSVFIFFSSYICTENKSMALGATILTLVLIKVTGPVVSTSPTLCLIHITFQPFLSPPSFFRFQQWWIRHILYNLVLRPLRRIEVRLKTRFPYFHCVRPSIERTQISGTFETKSAGPTCRY